VRIPGERAAYLDPDRSLKITAGQLRTVGEWIDLPESGR
jgi:hypothetical protein